MKNIKCLNCGHIVFKHDAKKKCKVRGCKCGGLKIKESVKKE